MREKELTDDPKQRETNPGKAAERVRVAVANDPKPPDPPPTPPPGSPGDKHA